MPVTVGQLKQPSAFLMGCQLSFQVFGLFTKRSFRVILLSMAIVTMSSADLYLTLLYVTQIGMNEMNPLARAMMEYQSPAILAIWKTATVLLSVGILLWIRKQPSAEIGAWVGCLVLGWLMIHWVSFVDKSQHLDLELAGAMNIDNPNWIMISPSPNDAATGFGVESIFSSVID
jgi:Domain of unknown function (DUF5658)